ncbi:MAG: NIPSNAP family protein [Gammaproteobacteria bacterium]
MKKIFLSLVIGLGLTGGALAQNAPAPCGPAGQLDAAFSADVADNSRCFELRMYTAEEGGIRDLHQRFREEEVAIFERLGATVVAVWQRLDDPNTLVWMLAYRDRGHRQEVWDAFRTDPAWLALREKYPVSVSAEVYMMSATDYSRTR